MHKPAVVCAAAIAAVWTTAFVGRAALSASGPAPAFAEATAGKPSASDPRALINEYCVPCHDNDKLKGGLTLEHFDPARAELNADIAEKMIKKLRAGMMPP